MKQWRRLRSVAFPDRALEPEAELATVAIRGAGHRMSIFKKMVQGPEEGEPATGWGPGAGGGRVGLPVGFGLWNGQSQVAIRVVSRLEDPPGAAYWEGKLATGGRASAAGTGARRRSTDAYRVVHAEGDGLSGLVVDRFGDVLSVEVFSLGMYQRAGSLLSRLARAAGDAARAAADGRGDRQGGRISSHGRSIASRCRRRW